MEPKRSISRWLRPVLIGFTLFVALASHPVACVDISADPEVVVQNGTTGILRCTFKSNQRVSNITSVTWSFQSSAPDSRFSKSAFNIFHFLSGMAFVDTDEFKGRVQFAGDLNKRDVSIRLSPTHFSDNGTYFCDVKNPPDVMGTQARTELRVVLKESLPQSTTAAIVGGVCGALLLLVLIAVSAYILMRVIHNRHNYEGCMSLESVSSRAPQPVKKVESSLDSSRSTGQSGQLQGPVIYAQLDHSGSKNSFHKMEPVVYADIRKN